MKTTPFAYSEARLTTARKVSSANPTGYYAFYDY